MFLGILMSAAIAAPSAACETLSIEALLSDDLRFIEGTATCAGPHAGEAAIATFPRILREPRGMDDINRLWTYPQGFDSGDMLLRTADAPLAGDGAWQAPPSVWPNDVGGIPASALPFQGREGSAVVRFRTRIPNRNGAFGARDGVAYLLGGWHPVWGDGKQLHRAAIRYTVKVPEHTVGFIGAKPFGQNDAHTLRGTFTGRYLPLLVAPAAHVRVTPQAVLIAPLDRRGNPAGHRDVTAPLDARAHDHILETLADGDAAARAAGLRAHPIIAVVAPLRHHLVEPFDGGLAVSDHAFHMLPFELIFKFHRATLWREQLAVLAMRHAAWVESTYPPELAADAVAAALRERLLRDKYGDHKQYAPDLLETVAVIPEIDALIFAPQVPFVETYYNAIDETPRARLRFDDFYHAMPRGKLLYEKLHDAWGEMTTQKVVSAYLRGDEDFVSCATHTGPGKAAEVLAPWLGPYPSLNYRLARVERSPHVTHVDIALEGPDSARIEEPIDVRVRGSHGMSAVGTRMGPGPIDILIDDPGVVELDPQGRLGEIFHAPGLSPRYDNRTPQRWRLLLNNISGLLAVTNAELTASADFSLRRIFDLRFGFDIFALYSPTAFGAAITANYNFGQEITALRLADSVSLQVEYDRLLAGGGATIPGQEISMGISYGRDTRLSPYFDFEGHAFSAGVSGGWAKDTAGHTYLYTQVSSSGLGILPLAFGHALVGRLRYDYTIGDAPVQDLLPIGGRYLGGRGYEIDEVRGRQRGLISAEYRHVLSGGNRTDFWGALMLTRLDGALFADAIYEPTHEAGCKREMFYDVGYGLRFIGDVLNISPTSLQVDFGLPLSRCANDVIKFPVSIYIAVLQSFSNF